MPREVSCLRRNGRGKHCNLAEFGGGSRDVGNKRKTQRMRTDPTTCGKYVGSSSRVQEGHGESAWRAWKQPRTCGRQCIPERHLPKQEASRTPERSCVVVPRVLVASEVFCDPCATSTVVSILCLLEGTRHTTTRCQTGAHGDPRRCSRQGTGATATLKRVAVRA